MLKRILFIVINIALLANYTFAQDEQVTVVGSLIKGTPIDTG